jgi:hypothetical protein
VDASLASPEKLTVVMLEKIREDGFAKSTQNQYARQQAFLSPQ